MEPGGNTLSDLPESHLSFAALRDSKAVTDSSPLCCSLHLPVISSARGPLGVLLAQRKNEQEGAPSFQVRARTGQSVMCVGFQD